METNKIIEEFDKILKRDRELSVRYPENIFYKKLAQNTEDCLNQIKKLLKLDLHIRNN